MGHPFKAIILTEIRPNRLVGEVLNVVAFGGWLAPVATSVVVKEEDSPLPCLEMLGAHDVWNNIKSHSSTPKIKATKASTAKPAMASMADVWEGSRSWIGSSTQRGIWPEKGFS